MDVTIFELHLPEAQFNAPFANRDTGEEPVAEHAEEAGGSGLRPAIALLVLVGLAALAWYLRGSDDDTGIEAATDGE